MSRKAEPSVRGGKRRLFPEKMAELPKMTSEGKLGCFRLVRKLALKV